MEIVLHNGLDTEVCDMRPDDYTTYTTARPTTTTTYDGRPIKSRIMIFNDLERPIRPVSRSLHAFFDTAYLRNGTRYRHQWNTGLTQALLNTVISNDLE